MQSAIFANKAFFVVLIAPVRRTIGVYSEPSFFDHFTVCRQMILIRDVVDRIDLKRYFGEVVSADFATVEIEHLIRENINGLLLIPFSAELVTGSKTSHAGGIKKVGLPTAVDDLDQAVQFFDSHYASDKMRSINITVYAEGIPEAIHNSAPGVERARCSFSVNFMQCTKGYAALAPSIGDYSEDHDSAAAKDVADVEAGWFDKAEVKRELENK